MSILKQVLSEAWSSVSRKGADEASTESPTNPVPLASSTAAPSVDVAARGGMKVVILNWKAGENDPFTVVNETIRQHLRACGKNVETIEITDPNWPSQLAELAPAGIQFALTWQGLGSHTMRGNESLWDHLKIPLICVHGDHPSHMPRNHQLESRYCFHLYTNAEFARYSNRHFRKRRSASVIDIPQLHRERGLGQRSGDHFVVVKNIYDPVITESVWQERMSKSVLDAYMGAAEALKARIANERYVEIHEALDEVIVQHRLDWLTSPGNPEAYHAFHSDLDHYLRSHKIVAAVAALRDFPICVYGRGWERVSKTAPSTHVFAPARNMADSRALYYSNYGLVDVSPSKGLHDRTRRAMANEVGFLSSANLEDSFPDFDRFDPLFFSFRAGELQTKAAAVVRDPESHAALARNFALKYHERFHFKHFVDRLDELARAAAAASS